MPFSKEKFKLQKTMYTASFCSQMRTPLLQFFPHFPSQSNQRRTTNPTPSELHPQTATDNAYHPKSSRPNATHSTSSESRSVFSADLVSGILKWDFFMVLLFLYHSVHGFFHAILMFFAAVLIPFFSLIYSL
jgi:hypothetical protein